MAVTYGRRIKRTSPPGRMEGSAEERGMDWATGFGRGGC